MGLLSVPSPKLTHSITWPSVSLRSYRHHSAGSHLQQEASRSQPWDCNRTGGPSEKRVLDNGHQDHNSWQTGPENVPTKAASGAREGDTFADQLRAGRGGGHRGRGGHRGSHRGGRSLYKQYRSFEEL